MDKRPIFRPRFWLTPTLISDDRRIEPFDEKVYAAVDWFHGMKDGECRASNNTLAELIRPTDPQPRSVQNSLNRLEECGYIRREYKDSAKRNRLRIIPMIELHLVRNRDDRQPASEPAMIDVRNGDDRASESVMTRVRIGSKKRSKNIALAPQDGADDIPRFIKMFEPMNPSVATLYGRPPQRKAISSLLKKYGPEKLERMIGAAAAAYDKQYAPTITTPMQLEAKLGQLIAYWKKEGGKRPMIATI